MAGTSPAMTAKYMAYTRSHCHARACHHKSGVPDLWRIFTRKSAKADFRGHPRLNGAAISKTWMAGTSPAMTA